MREAANVDRAVSLLCEAAGNGDIQAAKALIPWIDQALSKPTERVEHRMPTGLEELEFIDKHELERIVRLGREDRLRREREARERDGGDDDEPDWRARSVE
jgi:hypothetical protein